MFVHSGMLMSFVVAGTICGQLVGEELKEISFDRDSVVVDVPVAQTVCEYGFDIINSGTATLKGDEIRIYGSCGCEKMNYETAPLAPGERRRVTAIIDVTGINGDSTKAVLVRVGDVDKRFYVYIKTPQFASISPNGVIWNRKEMGTARIVSIEGMNGYVLRSIGVPSGDVRCSVVHVGGTAYEVRVGEVAAGAKTGNLFGRVELSFGAVEGDSLPIRKTQLLALLFGDG